MTMHDPSAVRARAAGGAERLIVEGLRRWLSGYATRSIDCWELAWILYDATLGTENAGRAVTGLSCFARVLNDHARCAFCLYSYDCPRRCRHECLAVDLIAASQAGDREHAAAIAEILVTGDGIDRTLEAAAVIAEALAGIGLVLPYKPTKTRASAVLALRPPASGTRH